MKTIVQISRVLVGLLFIFSGIIKLNDPKGLAIKLEEYFDVFSSDAAAKQDTLHFQVTSGGSLVADKKYVLYTFDKVRPLEIKSKVEKVESAPIDSSAIDSLKSRESRKGKHKATRYKVELVAFFSSEQFVLNTFETTDSQAVSVLAVKMKVKDKTFFQEDVKYSLASLPSLSRAIDVSSFVKQDSGWVDFYRWLKGWALFLSVSMCVLEVVLGFALLFGWNIRLTSWLLLLLILFFTFLTGYSAYYNKVTDCGCFGDFIKLKPWHSFYKDLVLLVLIGIVLFGKRHIKPWFSASFGWKLMGALTLLATTFGLYNYMYLPVWDFLPYKEGNNIYKIMTEVPPGMRATDSLQIEWVLKHKEKGDSVKFVDDKKMSKYIKYAGEGYEFSRRIEKVIIEGYKSPIHDFSITNAAGVNVTDSFMNHKGYQLVWISLYMDKGYNGGDQDLSLLTAEAKKLGIKVYGLTGNALDTAQKMADARKLGLEMFNGDQKMLLSMARYNPTLYLFKGPVVIRKWSGRSLPNANKLVKLTQ